MLAINAIINAVVAIIASLANAGVVNGAVVRVANHERPRGMRHWGLCMSSDSSCTHLDDLRSTDLTTALDLKRAGTSEKVMGINTQTYCQKPNGFKQNSPQSPFGFFSTFFSER